MVGQLRLLMFSHRMVRIRAVMMGEQKEVSDGLILLIANKVSDLMLDSEGKV